MATTYDVRGWPGSMTAVSVLTVWSRAVVGVPLPRWSADSTLHHHTRSPPLCPLPTVQPSLRQSLQCNITTTRLVNIAGLILYMHCLSWVVIE